MHLIGEYYWVTWVVCQNLSLMLFRLRSLYLHPFFSLPSPSSFIFPLSSPVLHDVYVLFCHAAGAAKASSYLPIIIAFHYSG